MYVEIDSVIRIVQPTAEVRERLEENLVIPNPMYQKLKKLGRDDTIRYKHIPEKMRMYIKSSNGSYSVPFGCLYGLRPMIRSSGAKVRTDFADAPDISAKGAECPIKLYDYQEEAIQALMRAKGGVLQAGCGAGKTITAVELIKRIGKRFLRICSTTDLLRQAIADIHEMYPGLDVGTITDGKVSMGRDGTVSTVQTLCRIKESVYANEFGTVVVDECHRAGADMTNRKMYQTVLSGIRARHKFGLSATPFRGDSTTSTIYMNLGMSPNGAFEPTYSVDRSKTNTMTAEVGYIDAHEGFNYHILGPDGTLEYSRMIDELASNQERNSEVAAAVMGLVAEGRKIAFLTTRVSHCEDMLARLQEKGVRAVMVTGETKDSARKAALADTSSRQVIVSTVALFKEGIDIRELDTVVMGLPIKDKASVIQSCGRCERKLEGKRQPLFLIVRDVNYPYCLGAARKMRSTIERRT